MNGTAELVFAIGAILLLGMATDFLGRRTFLPRVTLLLILGILLGDDVLGLIPVSLSEQFELLADMVLMIIGFLLGGRLSIDTLRTMGRQIAWVSVSAALCAAILVVGAMVLVRVSLEIAILLGCIASATAPAATVDTVLESKSQSLFSKVLLAVVAIDDAWALLFFSLGLSMVSMLNGSQDVFLSINEAAIEIGGGLAVGALVGIPGAYLTGRIKPGQPMLTEALGIVFLCGGASNLLGVSFLIAVMTAGAVISNAGKHHEYAFHEIENIEWPFMAIFFVLAGATLEIDALREIGVIGAAYVLARMVGKIAGGWLGGRIGAADANTRQWIGVALLPQAGVAIGMGLIAASRYPEYSQLILTVVVSTTVVFELLGPPLTRLALLKAKDPPRP